jgi:hypothetical protein
MDRSHGSHPSASAPQSHTTLPGWTDDAHPVGNSERHHTPGGHTESKTKLLDQVRIVLRLKHMSLIHAAANFASFFAFRGLSMNESPCWRMVWK